MASFRPDDMPIHQIGLAQEIRAENVGWPVVEFLRRSRCAYPALMHQRQSVGERERSRARVVVTSHVIDSRGRSYRIREPVEPGEIGRVLRQFLAVGLPLRIAPAQQYYVMMNHEDQVVAGIKDHIDRCQGKAPPEVLCDLGLDQRIGLALHD